MTFLSFRHDHIANRKKLRAAIVGCGKMGAHHARIVHASPYAELVAVCDANSGSVSRSFPAVPDIPLFSDAEDMLRKVTPDVVHVTTPLDTHASIARLALSHGANVYVEKPFCLYTEDAESIVALADCRGLKVCAGHQVLFEKAARRTIESLGVIGQIVHVESYFSFRTVRREITPVDQLMDILPHPVYLLLSILTSSCGGYESKRVELSSVQVNPHCDVHAILKAEDTTGVLVVTLRGRPIESYLRTVGTNGCLFSDFVLGTLTSLPGPGTSPVSILLNPYRRVKQTLTECTRSILRLMFKGHNNYPGLSELINSFHLSIVNGTAPPLPSDSIVKTVEICETIGRHLQHVEQASESLAEAELRQKEEALIPVQTERGLVVVTGGTGFLGRPVAAQLRGAGFPVRVVTRRIPRPSKRVPGVEYTTADLGDEVPAGILEGARTVIHCAAETAGGWDAHERNSLAATRNMVLSAAAAEVSQFIHVSSIAVLDSSREPGVSLHEDSPLVSDRSRGPYVWGKAASERLASDLCAGLSMPLRIVRLAPLIDFLAFEPPGRLGREAGPFFVAIGDRASRVCLCKMDTAVRVLHYYVCRFDEAPTILNLLEPNAPTRAELVKHLQSTRRDLRVIWLPWPALSVLSILAKAVFGVLFPSKEPMDVKKAFASEVYNTELSARIIRCTAEALGITDMKKCHL